MFHSAGYFKSTLCPFHEHGLCHRPHCHYSHKVKSKTSPPSAKKPSSLRSTSQGQSSSSPLNYDLSKVDDKMLSDVAMAISTVSNFFGSTDGKSQTPPMKETGKGSPQTQVTNELPSYAPEKCMEDFSSVEQSSNLLSTDYSLSTPQGGESGKGSSIKDVKNVITEDEPSLSSSVAPDNHIFTEESVFGGSIDDIHDDEPQIFHDDRCYGYVVNEDQPKDVPDVAVETEPVVLAPDMSKMEAEFNKVTALPDEERKKVDPRLSKKRKSEDEPYGNIVRKKWKAYSETQVFRETARVAPKTSTVKSNFSEMVSEKDLYMGKKRTATVSNDKAKAAVSRPKISLTVNAKVPTALRQKYLDGFIDEHLKMSLNPPDAYSKALQEEQVLYDRSSRKMIYMNHSTSALKHLREKANFFLEQQKAKSDERVEINRAKIKGQRVKIKPLPGREPEMKKERAGAKVKPLKKKKPDWRVIEAELQETFFTHTTKASDSKKTISEGSIKTSSEGLTADDGASKKTVSEGLTTKANDPQRTVSEGLTTKAGGSKKSVSEGISTKDGASNKTVSEGLTKKSSPSKKQKASCKDAVFDSSTFYSKVNQPSQPSGSKVNRPSQPSGSKVNQPSQPSGSKVNRPSQPSSSKVNQPSQPLKNTPQTSSSSEVKSTLHCDPPPSSLENDLFGDSNSDDEQAIESKHSIGTPSVLELAKKRRNSSSTRPASPFQDSSVDFIRVFGSDSSDEEMGVSFENALSAFDTPTKNKSKNLKSKKQKKDKTKRKSGGKTVKKKSTPTSKTSSKLSKLDLQTKPSRVVTSTPVTTTITAMAEQDFSKPPMADHDTSLSLGDKNNPIVLSQGSQLKRVPMLKLFRMVNVSRSPSSTTSSEPTMTSLPRSTSLPDSLVAMGDDSVFDDFIQVQEQTCHTSTKSPRQLSRSFSSTPSQKSSSSQPLQSPRSPSRSPSPIIRYRSKRWSPVKSDKYYLSRKYLPRKFSRSVASSRSSRSRSSSRSTTPTSLPSCSLINLSEVSAQHKQKVTDMASYARSLLSKEGRPERHGNKPPCQPFTVLKKKEIPLTPDTFYKYMCTYKLTEEQLVDNGYPRPTSEVGVASINRGDAPPPVIESTGTFSKRHKCCRCKKSFVIYNNGKYQTVDECFYHYGRLVKSKEYGEGVVSMYTCCQGRRDADGCQWAKLHVTSGESPTRDSGYVTTQPCSPSLNNHVYAVDCEMCYTTLGLQLTRVSVIDMELNAVYESLVKPSHPIVDYNTRFSGLKAEDFVSVTTTIDDVQQQLLSLVSSETILIGHSLESDLRSLKMIHSSVVDTALVFPHKKGLPFKRSLKALMTEYLLKFIQNDIDGGHDSLEDARSCMELMIWKVKGDLKKAARRSSDNH